MTDSALPPIGAYAMAHGGWQVERDVYKIVAIRGRVSTSAGQLVSPSPTITIEQVVNKTRIHLSAATFANDWRWEYAT